MQINNLDFLDKLATEIGPENKFDGTLSEFIEIIQRKDYSKAKYWG